jgi:hypothetical protein
MKKLNYYSQSTLHYRNPGLCRVPTSLPSVFSRAFDKAAFAESHTRQSPALGNELVYRVQDTQHRKLSAKTCLQSGRHSAKAALGKESSAAVLKLAAVSLCRGLRSTLGKEASLPSAKYLGQYAEALVRPLFI